MIGVEARLRALMVAAQAGDAASYRALLDELRHHLRRYFQRRAGNDRAADVDDLVQETLMAAHTRRATYDPSRPFTAWMHAIARYKLVDHFRRNRMRATVAIDDFDALFAPDESEAATARLDIDRLLESVPPRQSSLIRQVKLEGRSIAETAETAGMSQTAVKVGIHRSLKALAQRVQGRPPGKSDE